MSLNRKIISNLEDIFMDNFKVIQHPSLTQWIDLMIKENPDAFSINEQKTVKLYDEATIANFNRIKENRKVLECYERAIALDLNESDIVNRFSKDLITSFKNIKTGIREIENSKIQIIFLTYSFEPYAWISGYGEGDYPILKKPQYFDFNYYKEFFGILGRVDYSMVWSNLIEFKEYLEEANIYDDVLLTDFFTSLENSYIYKTYLLMNKAFEQNQEELFSDLNIKRPLFVYGHEHDCEKINVFCYE